jgi:hypothetical protein
LSARAREELHALVDRRMTRLRLRATKYALEMTTRRPVFHPETGAPILDRDGKQVELSAWELRRHDDRTVADVWCANIATIHEAGNRANKLANRPAGQLAVVVLPQRIEDPRAWEAKAKALEAQGRPVIDTTAGPATTREQEDAAILADIAAELKKP